MPFIWEKGFSGSGLLLMVFTLEEIRELAALPMQGKEVCVTVFIYPTASCRAARNTLRESAEKAGE